MVRLPARDKSRFFSLALILVGVALIGYVSYSYYTMYASQHRLAREWEDQQKLASQQSAKPVSDGLTRISIPKIDLNAVIVNGTSNKQLLLGPGLLEKTPAPGESGNAVVTAHRDTFFRHIYKLNKGDRIQVQRNGRAYQFEVTGKKIVDPSDTSVLKQTADPQLTLITCYPTYYIGPAPERLIVFSKQVEDLPSAAQAQAATQSK
ncbi:MAG TPA: class D sortase [Candidatus Nanoarchaeia archaeon]|nr:class D sortase [Candidatus Nanoarchaeia archaeon]